MKSLRPFLLIFILTLGNYIFSSENSLRVLVKPYESEIRLSDGAYLQGNYPPFTIEAEVLGSLVEIDEAINRANLTSYAELNRIIWYESRNDPTAKNPNSSAFGLCQMIKSTREWVAQDIKKETGYEIDYENSEDQLKACIYLYEEGVKENEWAETMPLWKL